MMNMNKLSRAGESIHLSEEAKKRIIAGCSAKLSENAGEFTDYVMPVERYRPRRTARFAAIAAAVCLIAGGGAALTFSRLSRSPDDKAANPTAGSELTDASQTAIDPAPRNVNDTVIGEFLANDFVRNGAYGLSYFSDIQRRQVREVFNGVTFTETEETVLGDDALCFQYQDGVSTATVSVRGDIVKYKYMYGLTGPIISKWFRLSGNIEDKLRDIYDNNFLFMTDETLYLPDGRTIDEAGCEKIRELFGRYSYKKADDMSTNGRLEDKNSVCLDCRVGTNYYRLSVCGNRIMCRNTTMRYRSDDLRDFDDLIDFSIAVDCEDLQSELAEIVREHTLNTNMIYVRFMSEVGNSDKYSVGCESSSDDSELTPKQYRGLTDILRRLDPVYDADFIAGDYYEFDYYAKEDCNDRHYFRISGDHIMLEDRWFRTTEPELCSKVKAILSGEDTDVSDLAERFDNTDKMFSLVLESDFYVLAEGDLDAEEQSAIRTYLRGLHYQNALFAKTDDLNSAAGVDLHSGGTDYSCDLHIHGCYFTYSLDYTDGNGTPHHKEQRIIATECDDSAQKILAVYGIS
ncbi:MAG: hypothetical protein IKO47_02500 [Ruminococcus sp.]|nr:hypothetical protein [Ruminococcus sp.]